MARQPYIFKGRPWLGQVLKISGEPYNLYTYGCKSLEREAERYYDAGLHEIEPYDKSYRPNAFQYQYDLEVHIFINYFKIKEREERYYQRRLKEKYNEEDAAKLEFIKAKGPTGIPRHEHIFNAAEIRWPTLEHTETGGSKKTTHLEGSFLREPWSIRRMEAVASKYNYIFAFGGGGQGKTWTFLGFMLMIFEHYLYTRNGAKCSFSSVNKDKINGVQWPHLQKLLTDTQSNRSLYAGRSIISGDWTLKRPGKIGKRDTGGVFKGILVGRNVQDAAVIDKLTGTHGHEAYCYLIDELQSTPVAPIRASANYLSTDVPAWVIGAANYNEDGDACGVNVKPLAGWAEVDETTGHWISETITESRAYVMHFNNDLSPAMLDDEMARLFRHLPNKKRLKRIYPNAASRNRDNLAYRRFWLGWRATDISANRVVTDQLVVSGQADKRLDLSKNYRSTFWGSLDTAEAGGDRTPFGIFADGMDSNTEEHVWGLTSMHNIATSADPRRVQQNACKDVIDLCRLNGIKSGNIIIDGTKNTGYAGAFFAKGFNVISLVYHKRIPDGKTPDKGSRRIPNAILINPLTMDYAHTLCHNQISLGAWLLREYVTHGKVRGLNEEMFSNLDGNHKSIEEEMYRRSLESKTTIEYGDRECLDSKEDFKDLYHFSPDLFDVWVQAAYFAFVHREIPLYDEVSDEETRANVKDYLAKTDEFGNPKSPDDIMEATNDIWEEDDYGISVEECDEYEIEFSS